MSKIVQEISIYTNVYRYCLVESVKHYSDIIMSMMASQITSLTSVYPIVYSGADQRKHQSSASLAFVRWPVNSPNTPHKGPVMRILFPFDDVIMTTFCEMITSIIKTWHLHQTRLAFNSFQYKPLLLLWSVVVNLTSIYGPCLQFSWLMHHVSP